MVKITREFRNEIKAKIASENLKGKNLMNLVDLIDFYNEELEGRGPGGETKLYTYAIIGAIREAERVGEIDSIEIPDEE